MFQIHDFTIPAANDPKNSNRVVIDDKLKTEYQGISGLTVWTPNYEDMRYIELELKLNGKEIFPAGFPAELYSVNQFRSTDNATLIVDFPEKSRIEGAITNNNPHEVEIQLIFFVKT